MAKETLVIVGSGWAAHYLQRHTDLTRYNIKVISPIRTLQYTPLLASAACGLFDFRLAEEPIKRQNRPDVEYYRATAERVDFQERTVICHNEARDLARGDITFPVPYDKLVLAPGCVSQTFGTPGAKEFAIFLRTTKDARQIQSRLLDMLDAASIPSLTDRDRKEILHIRVVGGGAVGIEATAELYDVWNDSLRFMYPRLDGLLQISIHDVAPELLSGFDSNFASYALKSLQTKKGIDIQTSSHIVKVEMAAIHTKEDGRLPYGMLIWATGNAANPLLEKLDVKKTETGLPRILTDRYLRVMQPDGSPIENVFAIGDAADIVEYSLPLLAEVALQKSEHLTKQLNKSDETLAPFEYTQRAHVAYLGGLDGVVGGKTEYTGKAAWIAWRSGSLGWTRSWKRRLWILLSWLEIWLVGRDIARY